MNCVDLTGDSSEDEPAHSNKRPASPLEPPSPKHPKPEPQPSAASALPECGCPNPVPLAELCFLDCGHSSCRGCVRGAVVHAIAHRRGAECSVCRQQMEDSELRDAGVSDELRAQVQQIQLDVLLAADENHLTCPRQDCGARFDAQAATQPPPGSFNGVKLSASAQAHFGSHRFRCPTCTQDFCKLCNASPYHLGLECTQAAAAASIPKCRFCGEDATGDSNAGLICSDSSCRDRARASCVRMHPECGHMCGGIRDEAKCLPCLHPECCDGEGQSADDFCNICWTEPLSAAPSIALTSCQHVFHQHCLLKCIEVGYPGVRITLGFLDCALCSAPLQHPRLASALAKWELLRKKLSKAGLARLKAEGLLKSPELQPGGAFHGKGPEGYALHRYCFFQCHQCSEPYFAGAARCNGQAQLQKREEMVCGPCSAKALGQTPQSCKLHKEEYIEFKCRFCCSIAAFFCWGTTHFCDRCHREWDKAPGQVKPKPCECSTPHPPNSKEASGEHCFGCSLCRCAKATQP